MTHLEEIRRRIQIAAQKSGRNTGDILLIAVSKGQSPSKIMEALRHGQTDFGENYAQELLEKIAALKDEKPTWHFIGHLQTNKVGKIIDGVEWLHSLDSLKLAETLHKKRKTPLKCLLEINLAEENNKTGLSKDAALELMPKLNDFSNIDLKGLMTLSPCSHFPELVLLLREINERRLYPKPLTELSMGMSGDFEKAIKAGATMVRIGTGLFGRRSS
ncbi:MAG: YggS family pyridoxal phosphate-dependent enzyme [Deltaproteobacteria bacterium]|nr:YggS family pyridoxal phosphate-dependent enzyme [Deltaproteobacteria bacterium]